MDVFLKNPCSMTKRMHNEVMEVLESQLIQPQKGGSTNKSQCKVKQSTCLDWQGTCGLLPFCQKTWFRHSLTAHVCVSNITEVDLNPPSLATEFFDIWKVLFIFLIYSHPRIWNF